ncbi:uncharacterized protein Z519_12447 [Cladophialophora bantiana CBS 173.52]|uniref:F-box domain-containing protein n=1 Tax=Cladophialophora bantiana (strain ATCC 10958 / CBS 173.52 / CDC B-1940 / NIH 8579) TaxID=1442370 RepID=A0A0D2FJV8_CLAB1|nr:uncharacterized protein Z519_12447 [Cladophialophora bantiana CBS 173.52]KIW86982.1 hypothetical protein Z519_12447 [Cladophialophora bantiana CBS 173.52]
MRNLMFFIAYDSSRGMFALKDVLPDHQPIDTKATLLSYITLSNGPIDSVNVLLTLQQPEHDDRKLVLTGHQQSHFFRLPFEIRLLIYIHLLSSMAPEKHPRDIQLKHHHELALELLLVNRQIYREARLVPFQHNAFDFAKWNGTGLLYCDLFLRRLRPWQRRGLRTIILDVLAISLTSPSHMQRWLGLCNELGCPEQGTNREAESARLATLRLTISGCIMTGGRHTFDINSRWVGDGLLKLTSLRLLEMTVDTEGVDEGLLPKFVADLRRKLCKAEIVLKKMHRGKSSVLYLPVSSAAISCYWPD